jgi:hypothetical protein
VKQQFIAASSRARPKEPAHDYLERDEAALLSSLVVQKWQQSRAAEKSPTTRQDTSPQDTLDARSTIRRGTLGRTRTKSTISRGMLKGFLQSCWSPPARTGRNPPIAESPPRPDRRDPLNSTNRKRHPSPKGRERIQTWFSFLIAAIHFVLKADPGSRASRSRRKHQAAEQHPVLSKLIRRNSGTQGR